MALPAPHGGSGGAAAEAGSASAPGGATARGGETSATGGSAASQGGRAGSSSAGRAVGGQGLPSMGGSSGGGGGMQAAGGGGTSSAGGSSGASGASSNPDVPAEGVAVDGRGLYVDGRPFHVRGVNWNPVPRGATHPSGLDYAGFAERDVPLMSAAGINAVRTYEPLLDTDVLDRLHAAGIYVLDTVYPYGGDEPSVVVDRVNAVKGHPAILMWVVGNEWNYNGLYVDLPLAEARARLNEAAALIKQNDDAHPVSTIYGELGQIEESLSGMPDIDVWGINAYRGISFGDLFDAWAERSDKPMYIGEYGADAFNANEGAYDPESQAEATVALTREILEHSQALAQGVCIGGLVFEFADEWWKVSGGDASVQENGGIAPGGGPYPDSTFNEEWWGIVDIDRTPRPAYDGLADLYTDPANLP